MQELERIKQSYERRDKGGKRNLYSFFKPDYLFASQQREKEVIELLVSNEICRIEGKKILDLGCGNGSVLRDFIRYGAKPENCHGIDLLESRIDEAKKISPNIHFRCANAETLPYNNAAFDLVLCFTVFTSIFDESMKNNLSQEMLRVLRPGGIILWYDYHMNNPHNPDVRGVKKQEILGLFSLCDVRLKRVTLAPPIARALVQYSWIGCYLLEKLKFLNTHYIGSIRKK